jgi:predicted permease
MNDSFITDLRYGVRQLLKSPSFTIIALLSLALGIGANTALFSLVDEVLLKLLPVKQPQELVLFKSATGQRPMRGSHDGTLMADPITGLRIGSSFSYPAFKQFQAQSQTLSDVFAFAPKGDLNVVIDGQAEIAAGQLITGGFHKGLGVQPELGRSIVEDDDQQGAAPVAVISYRYWQRRFGRDPLVAGKTVTVNGNSVTIVGVTPRRFHAGLQIGDSPDISLPLVAAPMLEANTARRSDANEAWRWWLRVMGRMKPGVNLDQVHAELESVFQQSALDGWNNLPANRRPPDYGPREFPTLRVISGSQGEIYLRQAYERPLRIIMIVVGLVLLIACANVANLLLVRAVNRRQEIAVRLALGASRLRLIRQLLTESVLLAGLGATFGLMLAWISKDLLLGWHPFGGDRVDAELQLDWRVFGFTAVVAIFTGLLFGLAPALRATRVDLNSALKENSRGSKGTLSALGKSLVVVQIAAALLMLVGAGLFIRTLKNLQSVELGFNPENLLLFRVDPQTKGYPRDQIGQLRQRLAERIQALPGVQSVTISEYPLLSGMGSNGGAYAHGREPLPDSERIVYQHRVRWNYLDAMEIPLLKGRGLREQDDTRAPKVAVVNQTMARRFFEDEDPIGKRFGFSRIENAGEYEIVGVVADSRYLRPRQGVPAMAYLSAEQHNPSWSDLYSIRTANEPSSMVATIREVVREVDKDLPIFNVKTQTEQADQSLAQERFFPKLTGFFGLLALLLASIGLYGVMSYSIAQRTHEIAIRMALGATQGSILKRCTSQGMLLAAIGIALGTGAALTLTHLIGNLLYGVSPTDPTTFMSIAGVLVAVALLACLIPAHRATSVDPMVALRYE